MFNSAGERCGDLRCIEILFKLLWVLNVLRNQTQSAAEDIMLNSIAWWLACLCGVEDVSVMASLVRSFPL